MRDHSRTGERRSQLMRRHDALCAVIWNAPHNSKEARAELRKVQAELRELPPRLTCYER